MEKEPATPVKFTIDGEDVYWDPQSERKLIALPGTAAATYVTAIENFIEDQIVNSPEISVTPVGPFLDATTDSLDTVVWAINSLYGDESKISVEGNAPTMDEVLGLDEVKKNGSSTIY